MTVASYCKLESHTGEKNIQHVSMLHTLRIFFLKIKSTCVHHDYILNIIVQYSIPALHNPKYCHLMFVFFLHEALSLN